MNVNDTIGTNDAGRQAAAIRGRPTTAGPWRKEKSRVTGRYVIIGAAGEVIGHTSGFQIDNATEAANALILTEAPNLLAALKALVAVAPANAEEDPEILAALCLANQAIVDAEGRRRCDFCCGTGFMRVMGTNQRVLCNRPEHA